MIVSVARDLGDRDVQDDVEEPALFETKNDPKLQTGVSGFPLISLLPHFNAAR